MSFNSSYTCDSCCKKSPDAEYWIDLTVKTRSRFGYSYSWDLLATAVGAIAAHDPDLAKQLSGYGEL